MPNSPFSSKEVNSLLRFLHFGRTDGGDKRRRRMILLIGFQRRSWLGERGIQRRAGAKCSRGILWQWGAFPPLVGLLLDPMAIELAFLTVANSRTYLNIFNRLVIMFLRSFVLQQVLILRFIELNLLHLFFLINTVSLSLG